MSMEIYDVVKKLVGKINPVGETYTDDERFKNLNVMAELVDKLLIDIDRVIPNKYRGEFSMKRAGKFADDFFTKIGIVE